MSDVLSLQQFGWDEAWQQCASRALHEINVAGHGRGGTTTLGSSLPSWQPARVAVEYPSEYALLTSQGERRAVLAGRLRGRAKGGGAIRPVVGDWVLAADRGPDSHAVIHAVLDRRTSLIRKAAGRVKREQVIAANVDVVWIVLSAEAPANPRGLERYLALVRDSGAQPVVVVTKADLCSDIAAYQTSIAPVIGSAPVHVVSATRGAGVRELDVYLRLPRTVALVGTSGAGKSTLVNAWLGVERQTTGALRQDGKGRHTTTNRFLLSVTPYHPDLQGLVMDTPGMRELGLFDTREGVLETFADVEQWAEQCRFRDCAHVHEPGCAVRRAIAEGRLRAERLQSYRALNHESRKSRGR
jgi:ribosome biogenesis GTPase